MRTASNPQRYTKSLAVIYVTCADVMKTNHLKNNRNASIKSRAFICETEKFYLQNRNYLPAKQMLSIYETENIYPQNKPHFSAK